LKYQKIVIASDRDFDGHKIAALMMVFFNHFPELFEQHVICRIISPIIICTKGKGKKQEVKKYYDLATFRDEQKKLKDWEIKYVKGLGGQNQSQYREMMQSNNFEYYTKNEITDTILTKWFGKGIASVRKDMLKENVEA
jgi:DNA topoisomerase-2